MAPVIAVSWYTAVTGITGAIELNLLAARTVVMHETILKRNSK